MKGFWTNESVKSFSGSHSPFVARCKVALGGRFTRFAQGEIVTAFKVSGSRLLKIQKRPLPRRSPKNLPLFSAAENQFHTLTDGQYGTMSSFESIRRLKKLLAECEKEAA